MAKELNLGVIFYGVATKAMQSIDQLEARLKKLNTGFVVSGKAATSSSKAISGQVKSAKGLANEMSLVGKKIGQVTGGIQRLTAAMKVTASYGLAATAIFGVINAFKAGTAAIFDFDQALKNLQAITGAIDAEIAVLGDKIREVAARTKYSAKEVSDATVLLGQAGFDAAESLDAIEAVAMLATGTLTDMATTADLLTTAIRAFDLETSEAGKVADIFATAVNKSKLTIDKLRTAFNYLGPVASNAGLSLEETAASTMVLANAGLRGSTIGTGFRQVLARLIAPSEKLRLAFRAAGADLEKLNPLTNDFSVVLDELSKVVTHTGVAIRLFGMRGSAAAVALAKGNDKYKEMLDYVYRVGVAIKMAKKQMEGLAVMAKNLGDKLYNLAIALGEGGIAGAFRVVLNILRPLVDLMTLAADNVIGRFIVAVTSLTVVVTALSLAVRYLVIQLSAITIGLSVAALKAKMFKEGASLLVVTIAGLNMAIGKLFMALKNHPFVAVIALLASLYAGFKLWRRTVAEQTIELQKQSIMLAKAGFQLEAYAEQLDKAKEGSREYEAIMERLLNDYPGLADAVDLTTMKWKDQGEALKELIDLKHDEYVGKLIELVGEYGDKIDSLRVKIALYALTIGKVTKDTKEFWEETKRGEYAFPGAEKLAGKIIEAFGTAWDFMKFSTKEASDFYKKKLLGMAEDTEEVAETIELQQETIKTLANELKGYGIDAESTIGAIAASIYALGEESMEAAIKMAEAVKQYLGTSIVPKVDAGKRLTNLEMLLDKEWHAWGELYQKLDWLQQNNLVEAFEAAEKKITKEREVLKIRYAMELANAETRAETEKKIQAVLVDIRAKALQKFKDDLKDQGKTYKEFFDNVKRMHLKALGESEQAEKKAAENRHAKRMADFKKDFEAEDDYLIQAGKAKIRSHDLMEKERAAITEKYAKERLDNETEIAVETEKLMLEIAKKGVDKRVAAGIDTIAEGNREKAQLEVDYYEAVMQIYTNLFNEIKKKYKEGTEEYVKYLNKLLEATAEFEKAQAKLITIDLEDLKATEKIYEQFLNNVQNAFADTFYEIFESGYQGWEKLLESMKSVFFRIASEIAAKTITVTMSSDTDEVEDLDWKSGIYSVLAGLLFDVVGDIFSESDSDKWRKQEEARIAKLQLAWKAFNFDMNEMFYTFSEVGQQINKIHLQFDEYRTVLMKLGAEEEKLIKVEEKRMEAIAQLKDQLKEAFITPLQDMIAGFTLDPMANELYQLNTWYASLIDQARALGRESVVFLREAYELSKKQLVLKEQEALLSAIGGFEDIINTIGKTAIEVQLYYLEKAKLEADVDVTEFQQDIDDLEDDIDRAGDTITDLENAMHDALTSFEREFVLPDYQEILGGAWTVGPEEMADQMVALYKDFFEDQGMDYNLSEIVYYGMEKYLKDWVEGFGGQDITDELNLLYAAWRQHEDDYLALIEGIPGEIIDLETAILGWEGDIIDLQKLIDDLITAGSEAYRLQLEALKESVPEGWNEIIRDLTLTDFEKGLFSLDEWYAEQLVAAEVLGLALDDLNLAYDLQLHALQNLGDAIDETIKSIDDMIESLTGGALAPVQSAEYYMDKYAGFLEAAMMGTAGAVDELLGFIPEYLDFMSGYGLDYAGLTASIVAQLENLKLTLPGLQHGGLTSGLSFAGEAGPEWVVPTYEPQRSSFLEDVGMDPVAIGRTIAGELLASGGKDIHVHVEINQREIGYATAKELRSNSELINAVRRVN